MAGQYWLDLFTGTTWQEFRSARTGITGFRESRWGTVQKIQPGDRLLCYLTGLSRFIGVLEVESHGFLDQTPIWKDEVFPSRLKVRDLVAEAFALKQALPLSFDEVTTRTIEFIDVLWLKGNAIVAAFEVESTTSVYSGLLRMSDLLAMQPNLNIPLYLVAPDERRDKVLSEVNRPTFSRLDPPLAEVCRFISFSTLGERLKEVAPIVRYLKPEFLEEIAEDCQLYDS